MYDATFWAQQIKQKKISSTELLTKIQQNIQQINPKINALFPTSNDAFQEALHFGQQQQKNNRHAPFCGVPIPLKALGQERVNWPNTNGSKLFASSRSNSTNHFVQKIEKAGFVPFMQTNVPEFGFKNITDSKLYGPARNPWNLSYSPGGSSGGAASAVASGLFPLATASDGGGSIRIPASFCGLIGLKPTRGSMPTGPKEWRSWQGASIHFALTLSMRDTETLFHALKTSDKRAPFQSPVTPNLQHKPKQKIAFCIESPVQTTYSSATKQAFYELLTFLDRAGHELTEIKYPVKGQQLIQSYYQMNAGETASFLDQVAQSRNRPIQKNEIEPLSWTLYQYGRQLTATEILQSLQYWDEANATMEELFQTYDLFLCPTTADTAPKIEEVFQEPLIYQKMQHAEQLSKIELMWLTEEMFSKSLAWTPYTQLANLAGHPALSLPTYISPEGLPLGMQFSASKGREDLLFHIGYELEQAQQFHLPPFYY